MRSDTSGLLFTQNENGSIIVEVIDYDISEFGGRDLEIRYDLDKENAKVLYEELKKIHKGTFEEMLIIEFSETFNTRKFEAFCNERNIKFHYSTWSSFN